MGRVGESKWGGSEKGREGVRVRLRVWERERGRE